MALAAALLCLAGCAGGPERKDPFTVELRNPDEHYTLDVTPALLTLHVTGPGGPGAVHLARKAQPFPPRVTVHLHGRAVLESFRAGTATALMLCTLVSSGPRGYTYDCRLNEQPVDLALRADDGIVVELPPAMFTPKTGVVDIEWVASGR